MFDFLRDVTKGVASVVGVVAGTVIGVPLQVVAKTLGITVDMVKEAMESGCTTYDEIKRHFDLD